jgi:hypothetical protein
MNELEVERRPQGLVGMKVMCRYLGVLALAMCSTVVWGSCSGSLVGENIPVASVYPQYRLVYIGEVVGLRLLTSQPQHNSIAKYEVTFRPMTILKGRAPRSQKGTFQHEYYEKQPPSSKLSGDLSEVVVSDGGRSFTFGEKYLIFSQTSGSLGAIGVCDQRVVGLSSKVLEQLSPYLMTANISLELTAMDKVVTSRAGARPAQLGR